MARQQNTLEYDVIDWLQCLMLPSYIAKIPAGHIVSIAGDEIWIDGEGNQLTYDQYKEKWLTDPKVVWQAIKLYRSRKKSSVTIIRDK